MDCDETLNIYHMFLCIKQGTCSNYCWMLAKGDDPTYTVHVFLRLRVQLQLATSLSVYIFYKMYISTLLTIHYPTAVLSSHY